MDEAAKKAVEVVISSTLVTRGTFVVPADIAQDETRMTNILEGARTTGGINLPRDQIYLPSDLSTRGQKEAWLDTVVWNGQWKTAANAAGLVLTVQGRPVYTYNPDGTQGGPVMRTWDELAYVGSQSETPAVRGMTPGNRAFHDLANNPARSQ
jgi:hypothetical protein